MRSIIRISMLVVFVLVFTDCVVADDLMYRQAELFGAEELQKSIPDDAAKLIEGQDPLRESNLLEGISSVFSGAIGSSGEQIYGAIETMLQLILIIVICQIADSICTEAGKKITVITGAFAICATSISGLHSMIGLGRETVQELKDYSDMLLPVMVSAATASGSVSRAGAIYTVATLFSNLIVRFMNSIILPAVYAYVSLALADAVTRQERLKQLREFLGVFVEKSLKWSVYLFTAFVTVTGIISGNADSAMLRAAKATITGMVPVVGSIISGAAGSVFSTASMLKGTIGVFGIISLFAIFITPLIRIGLSGLTYKLAAAIGGIFDNKHSSLLNSISKAMGYVIAMVGGGAYVCLLSCCCLIGVVQI